MKCFLQKRKNRNTYFSLFSRTEEGNMLIDEIGSFLVLIFCIVMILMYASYTKMVQQKITIDNKAMEYLYVMEENGYLSSASQIEMKNELSNIGVTVVNFTGTTSTQAEYGTKIRLKCLVSFPNPLYTNLSKENHPNSLFKIIGLQQNISYQIDITSTSKW